MELAYGILTDHRKNHYILDDNYGNFYFLTNDEKVEWILQFLIEPDLIDELNEILMGDFSSDFEPFFGSDTKR